MTEDGGHDFLGKIKNKAGGVLKSFRKNPQPPPVSEVSPLNVKPEEEKQKDWFEKLPNLLQQQIGEMIEDFFSMLTPDKSKWQVLKDRTIHRTGVNQIYQVTDSETGTRAIILGNPSEAEIVKKELTGLQNYAEKSSL